MKDFKKPGMFNDRGGRSNSGRPSFGRPSFNNRGRDNKFGPPEMHEAICANCGQKCEVPFRPNDKKPVYCRDCFGRMGGGSGNDRAPKKDFNSRPPAKHQLENRGNESADQTTKQLEAVNAKLERLIRVVEALGSFGQNKTESTPSAVAEKIAPPSNAPKKVSKKRTPKK